MPAPKGKVTVPLGFDSLGNLLSMLMESSGAVHVYIEGGTVTLGTHDLLDGDIHPDTVAGSPVEGDLIVGIDQGASQIKWQRLARGTSGQVLTSQSDGSLAWASPSGGDWRLIEIQDLSVDGLALDFQNIPSSYKHLRLIGAMRSKIAATTETVLLRFNNDSGANYYGLRMGVQHSATLSTAEMIAATGLQIFGMAGNTAPANSFSPVDIVIPDYANTTDHKGVTTSGFSHIATTTGNQVFQLGGGVWKSTSAISRVACSSTGGSNLAAGSVLSLYGLT